MGQTALGILFGCLAPSFEDEDEGGYALVERWERFANVPYHDRDELRIRSEHPEGTDTDLIGVWIAVGGSGEDGAPYLGEIAIRLKDIETHFQAEKLKAQALWNRFVDFCLNQEKIKLAKPELWLISCEVA